MRLSRTVMFGSLRFQNSENFVSLTFSFFFHVRLKKRRDVILHALCNGPRMLWSDQQFRENKCCTQKTGNLLFLHKPGSEFQGQTVRICMNTIKNSVSGIPNGRVYYCSKINSLYLLRRQIFISGSKYAFMVANTHLWQQIGSVSISYGRKYAFVVANRDCEYLLRQQICTEYLLRQQVRTYGSKYAQQSLSLSLSPHRKSRAQR